MKKLSKILLISVLSAFLMAGVVVTSATAGPIPPSPQPLPSAGESDLTSFITGPASAVNVDWMVVSYPGAPLLADMSNLGGGVIPASYLYMFQIENTTAAEGIDAFSVSIPMGVFGTILGAGVLSPFLGAVDDLDVVTAFHGSHSDAAGTEGAAGGAFPLLAGEGPFPGGAAVPLGALLTTIDATDGTITWTFSPVPVGSESETMWFASTQPPAYGFAVAQDTTPPSPWGSLAVGGDPVPVPVPEPATMTLLGIGLLGLGGIGRKKFSKK